MSSGGVSTELRHNSSLRDNHHGLHSVSILYLQIVWNRTEGWLNITSAVGPIRISWCVYSIYAADADVVMW